MNTQVLFALGVMISILGWTLISVSDLKADMKLALYQIASIQETLNEKDN